MPTYHLKKLGMQCTVEINYRETFKAHAGNGTKPIS